MLQKTIGIWALKKFGPKLIDRIDGNRKTPFVQLKFENCSGCPLQRLNNTVTIVDRTVTHVADNIKFNVTWLIGKVTHITNDRTITINA